MQTITIDEFVNGFSLRGFDTKTAQYFLNETTDERLDALRRVSRWVNDQIIKELEAKQAYASIV